MRFLLDSNIWRYFVDCGAVGRLVKAVDRSGCSLCVAPASLYEAAHCQDPSVRSLLLNAMTLPGWKRLMPEAFHETEEFKTEVRSCRPEWLKPNPKLDEWTALKFDWHRKRGGAWDRVRRDPRLISDTQGPVLEVARDHARRVRNEAATWSPKWETAPLTSIFASEVEDLHEFSNEPMEAWRFSALLAYWTAFSDERHPYVEWIRGEVDVDLMLSQKASLKSFWIHDVQLSGMKRNWLRWAFEFLQRFHKVTDGTVVDCQLGTYLLDVDLFISADRVLVGIAERCRREGPFPIARSLRVPGGPAAVEAVLNEVAGLTRYQKRYVGR